RPTIDEDQMVTLEVAPSIIRPVPSLGNDRVPGFSVQAVSTTARVQANQSLIIAGLMRFEEGLSESGIPGLRKIPVGLFSWKHKSRREVELLFIITPRLVLTEPTEIVTPVEMPDFNTVELPELDWPKERRGWRKDFDPAQLRPDGVPPTFIPGEDEGYEYEFYDENGGADAGVGEVEPIDAYEQDAGQAIENDSADDGMQMEDTPAGAAGEPDSDVEVSQNGYPQTRIVSADPCLNLRPSAGIFDSPIDCLPMGTVVTVLEHQGVWARVRLQNGQEGWMAISYLISREQLNDASSTIDTGAGGMVTADEFANLLLQRRPTRIGMTARPTQLASKLNRAEVSQTALEAQLQELQAGISRAESQARSNRN
ncbi:MAG: SH3 domain-containing protein, partial [Thermoanaerobaculia bacterium]